MRLRENCRILIEHSTPLVSQDLREIVEIAGASEVVLGVPGLPPADEFDLWIAEADGADADISEILVKADGIATQTILVVSGMRALNDLPPTVHVLTEPFRTEDVVQILCDAGLTGPDAD